MSILMLERLNSESGLSLARKELWAVFDLDIHTPASVELLLPDEIGVDISSKLGHTGVPSSRLYRSLLADNSSLDVIFTNRDGTISNEYVNLCRTMTRQVVE